MAAFDFFRNLYRSRIPNAAKGNRTLERMAVHNAMGMGSSDRPWKHDPDAFVKAALSEDPMADIKQDPNTIDGIVERMTNGTYGMPDDI